VDGCDTYMSKWLLRLCVYIYKGLMLVSKSVFRGVKRIFYTSSDDLKELSKKTDRII